MAVVIKATEGEEILTGKPGWVSRFFFLWTSQAFSLLGSQLISFALIWYLTQSTGSAAVLTGATLAGLLPIVFLSPFTGVLIDRWSRKKIMIAANVWIALASTGLALLFAFGSVKISYIYLCILILAVSTVFNNPAMIASTSLMVPDRHLTRVQGMNQSLQGGLSIITGPLGAFLLDALPMHAILAINLPVTLVAVICLLLIVIPQPERSAQQVGAVVREMQSGFRYVLGWPGLCVLIAIAVVINFLDYPTVALTPLLVAKHFNGSAYQLGWMNSAFGVGTILGGLTLSVWGGFKRRMVTAMLGIIGMGIGALCIGLAPAAAFWLAVTAIFSKGFMQIMTNGPIIATLQSTVDPAMQGRVMSLVISLTSAAAPVGLLIAGPLAERLGVQSWFICLSIACLVLGIAGFRMPSIMGLDDRHLSSKPGSI